VERERTKDAARGGRTTARCRVATQGFARASRSRIDAILKASPPSSSGHGAHSTAASSTISNRGIEIDREQQVGRQALWGLTSRRAPLKLGDLR